MRVLMVAVALTAVPAAAQAQGSAWGVFGGEGNDSSGAGVQSADGSQLILKCDKPGRYEVHAVVFSSSKLVGPARRPVMSTITFRFDDGAAVKENWRFYEQTAVAVDQTNERALSRFLERLADAKKLNLRLEPEGRQPLDLSFDVAGARDAIAQVYQSCKDENPLG